MRIVTVIFTLLFLFQTGKAAPRPAGNDTILNIIDFIDIPGRWTGGENGSWYIEFSETWVIPENLTGMGKRVESYTIHSGGTDSNAGDRTIISLDSILPDLKANHPKPGREILLGNISYEFTLLDPHSPCSDNVSFTGPLSMDLSAREIQEALISLALKGYPPAKKYDLKNELLSVWFHEEWFLDSATGEITKKVRGITPVLWQRRMTVEGNPVDEADTGYPVYYKNRLSRINLRNL